MESSLPTAVSNIQEEVTSLGNKVIEEVNEKIIELREVADKVVKTGSLAPLTESAVASSCLPVWTWLSSLVKGLHSVPSKPSVLSSTAPTQ